MNNCPQCGKPLPLQNMKFCPECGCNLSAQSVEDYDVICPDCNSVITDENSDCPNCGCPPNLFTRRAKANSLHGEPLECPDCGMVFEDTIPTECPNCGCPSERYKLHTDNSENKKEPAIKPLKKSTILSFLIILLLIIGVGAFIQDANEKREKEAERARQEQYEREQAEQRERKEKEEREAKQRQERELQRQKEQMMNAVVGTWRSETIRTRSGYCSMYLYFYSSGKFECKLYDNISGYCLDRQSGTFSVVPKSSGGSAGIVLNPNSSNSSWIEYKEGSFSDFLYFGDYSFTKSSSY